jgi:hypothetical protein
MDIWMGKPVGISCRLRANKIPKLLDHPDPTNKTREVINNYHMFR